MKTKYETIFEKLTSSITNFIEFNQLKHPLKMREQAAYLIKISDNSINLDDHIGKGLNKNIDLKNADFKNQSSDIKKIQYVFQLFVELKNFLLHFVKSVHSATDFFEEFKQNEQDFEYFIEDQLWKNFIQHQSSLFNHMKVIVGKMKKNIQNDMNKHLIIQNFYELRISLNFELSFKIDNALKEEKLDRILPDFVKNRFFEPKLLLERWHYSVFCKIYQKSYIEFDKETKALITKSIFKCLKDPKRFLKRIGNLDLSLLAQIFFLSVPDKLNLESMEIQRQINQSFYDSYFTEIIEENIFREIMSFFMDLIIFKSQKEIRLKHLHMRPFELETEQLIKIIVFFTISCINEDGRINLNLRNKLKYVFENIMTKKLSFTTYHIFDLIERIFHEFLNKQFFILENTENTRKLMKKAIEILKNKDIYVKESYLSILKKNLNEADTKLANFLNKTQIQVKNVKQPKMFKLKHLSYDIVSRVPVICVSGYLSKDTDKIEEWNHLCLRLPKSEVIALLWESGDTNSIKSFLQNGFEVFKDFYELQLFASIGRFLKPLYKTYSIWNNIPLLQEFDETKRVGVYLAHFLAEKESNLMHGFNLMGFSLGTSVIFNCLLELERINSNREKNDQLVLINDVILMGSVVDRDELKKLSLKSIAGNLINCYSENDYMLKYLHKIVKPSVSPIGIQKIGHDDPKVIDIDCTDIINGHFEFRNKMDLVLHRIDYNSDIYSFK